MLTIRISSGLSLLLCLLAVTCAQADSAPDAMLIWGERQPGQDYNLYFSQREHGVWIEPETVSATDKPDILPTLSADASGKIWAAWTELDSRHPRIRFRSRSHGTWGLPGRIKTSTTADMAPSIAIGDGDVPWLVWAGSRETDSDIYFSRWRGQSWDVPHMINRDDDLPDILPRIERRADGRLTVTWQGYNGDRYVAYRSHWLGGGWSQEEVVPPSPPQNAARAVVPGQEVAALLPGFIHDVSQASLHIRGQNPRTIKIKPALTQ